MAESPDVEPTLHASGIIISHWFDSDEADHIDEEEAALWGTDSEDEGVDCYGGLLIRLNAKPQHVDIRLEDTGEENVGAFVGMGEAIHKVFEVGGPQEVPYLSGGLALEVRGQAVVLSQTVIKIGAKKIEDCVSVIRSYSVDLRGFIAEFLRALMAFHADLKSRGGGERMSEVEGALKSFKRNVVKKLTVAE